MRLILGIFAVLLAFMVGSVEFRAVAHPAVAQSISNGFATHDPFPRLPWDYHIIFILAFLGLLASGLHLIFKRKARDTSRI
jgi:H+/Cl- antiporter ClcA